MPDLTYAAAPIVGYLGAGTLKFAINSITARRLAFGKIGMGGIPSTHTTIVTSATALAGFRAGIDTPLFSLAVAVMMIVVIDAMDLRRKIGQHASALRRLMPDGSGMELRERIGHSAIEIFAGVVLGILIGTVLADW
jgi:uncharacterized protein